MPSGAPYQFLKTFRIFFSFLVWQYMLIVNDYIVSSSRIPEIQQCPFILSCHSYLWSNPAVFLLLEPHLCSQILLRCLFSSISHIQKLSNVFPVTPLVFSENILYFAIWKVDNSQIFTYIPLNKFLQFVSLFLHFVISSKEKAGYIFN